MSRLIQSCVHVQSFTFHYDFVVLWLILNILSLKLVKLSKNLSFVVHMKLSLTEISETLGLVGKLFRYHKFLTLSRSMKVLILTLYLFVLIFSKVTHLVKLIPETISMLLLRAARFIAVIPLTAKHVVMSSLSRQFPTNRAARENVLSSSTLLSWMLGAAKAPAINMAQTTNTFIFILHVKH